MPERDYVWLPKQSILTFEEITRLVAVFASLGAHKVRLTGGEPLLRHDLPALTRMLAAVPGVRDLAMTTNGLLLATQASELRGAGLGRITVSLDTLRPDRMREIARTDRHADVLAGIAAARAAGFDRVKINTVVMRGVNDDELVDLIEFARKDDAEVRFIEYMDVGGATAWSPEQVFSRREILAVLSQRYGSITQRSRRTFPSNRRHDVRHCGVHYGTVLPLLRPQPNHGRWDVVHVPIRGEGHRFARTAAQRCNRCRAGGSHHRWLAGPHGPWRGRAFRPRRAVGAVSARSVARRSAPGDAYKGRVRFA